MDNSFLHNKKLLLVDDEPELLKLDGCTVDFSRAEVDKGGRICRK